MNATWQTASAGSRVIRCRLQPTLSNQFSLTAGCRGASCSSGWLGQLQNWCREVHCTYFALAQKMSKRAELLHVKGVFESSQTAP